MRQYDMTRVRKAMGDEEFAKFQADLDGLNADNKELNKQLKEQAATINQYVAKEQKASLEAELDKAGVKPAFRDWIARDLEGKSTEEVQKALAELKEAKGEVFVTEAAPVAPEPAQTAPWSPAEAAKPAEAPKPVAKPTNSVPLPSRPATTSDPDAGYRIHRA